MTSAMEFKELPQSTLFGVPIELKLSRDDVAGEIQGYGSTFGNVDKGGDVVLKGAFKDTLAKHKADGTMPAMLWQHQSDKPIGTWLHMAEDEKGLAIQGRLDLNVQAAREARSLLIGKAMTGVSIGFVTKEAEIDRTTGVRQIKKLELWEISLVTFAMNPAARISEAKSLGADKDIEELLRSKRLSLSQARAFIAGGWKALSTSLPESHKLLEAVKSATADIKGI